MLDTKRDAARLDRLKVAGGEQKGLADILLVRGGIREHVGKRGHARQPFAADEPPRHASGLSSSALIVGAALERSKSASPIATTRAGPAASGATRGRRALPAR
jgi:hypothetical protein